MNKSGKTRFRQDTVDQDEFINFYYSVIEQPTLNCVYMKYSTTPDGRMSFEDLVKFHSEVQKTNFSESDFDLLLDSFEPNKEMRSLSREGFTRYIYYSDVNLLESREKTEAVYQDMTKPLSHYFIASSHNT